MEMLLLLAWRHLSVYASDELSSAELMAAQHFGASVFRVPSSFDARTFRSDASRRLAPVIHKLGVMVRLFSPNVSLIM